jgi:protein phosphatase
LLSANGEASFAPKTSNSLEFHHAVQVGTRVASDCCILRSKALSLVRNDPTEHADRMLSSTSDLSARGASADGARLTWGGCSRPASGKANEDFYALLDPSAAQSGRSETLVAIADGISADGGARGITEAAVLGLVSDYFGTPSKWSVAQALDRLLRATNDWVWAHNISSPGRDGITSAVSVLVLQHGQFYLAHVGDTRVYRRRQGVLSQLTVDHVWPRRDLRHVLRRAIGLDSHLVVDFADGELEPGDIFLMVTDGVWEVLGDRRMDEILNREADPELVARALVAAAHERQAAYMGRNDATAVVVRVERACA